MTDDKENTENNDDFLQQKYGFDITYDPDRQKFILRKDGVSTYIDDIDLSQDEWNDEHLDHMRQKFSDDTRFEYVTADFYNALKEGNTMPLMSYEDNKVTAYQYTLNEDERELCADIIQEKLGCDRERSEQIINLYISDNLVSKIASAEHELSHLEDDKKYGNTQYDLPPEYMARLDMMTEIKASMTEAGLALDVYKATGDLSYFDNLIIDTTDLKTNLKENPDMENKETYVAQYVYDKWLETYNKEGSLYYQQAYNNASPSYNRYPLWALQENSQTLAQYHERTDAMFENIIGLGDVRKIANPDFELNEELKWDLDCDNIMNVYTLRKLMTKDAQNAKQYIENLLAYLEKVKAADADGIRTPEEIKQLDEHLSNVSQTQTTKDNTLDMATIAAAKNNQYGQ